MVVSIDDGEVIIHRRELSSHAMIRLHDDRSQWRKNI